LSNLTGSNAGTIAEEFHSRFAQPLFCIIAAMIGFSTLLVGGYSRFGVWREVVIAFMLLIAIDGLRGVFVDPVRQDASVWPLMYLPSAIGVALVLAMLWQASHPNWLRRLRRGKVAT
jgi:lipopolysaccharide export system permease protein